MPVFTAPIPLSVYIHIPWCVRKCPYCDFNSHAQREALPEEAYINALMRDLESKLPSVWGRRIESVFIGGGTPSLFAPNAIGRILKGLRERLPLRPDTEITMEANPGTVEASQFSGFREAGVNRLSMGIQSFNDQHLQALGRIHSAEQAKCAIDIAREAGFDNLNLDLMFALPQQSARQSLDDLETAIAFAPRHISFYQLTIEPNTLFHAQPPPTPSGDIAWEMQKNGQKLLARYGYEQYEVSAYARDDQCCRHNLNYWQFGDYLGLGAGAHGKITDASQGNVTRHWNHRQPVEYMSRAQEGSPVQGHSTLDSKELRFEFMLNALRLTHGVANTLYNERTGLNLEDLESELKNAQERGLLSRDGQRLVTTALGAQHLNELMLQFLPDDPE